jgi:hypothetical protein
MTSIPYGEIGRDLIRVLPDDGSIPKMHAQAGQHQTWFSSDAEAQFRKNGHNIFAERDVDYKFNSDGYRSPEFSERGAINILYAGCSRTFCTGLPEDIAMPAQLTRNISDLAGRPIHYWSIAHPSLSNDAISRLLVFALPFLKPDWLFVQFAPIFRREYFHEDGQMRRVLLNRTPKEVDKPMRIAQEAFLDLASDHENILNLFRAYKLVQATAQQHAKGWSHTFVQFDVAQSFPNLLDKESFLGFGVNNIDLARDNAHAGPKSVSHFCAKAAPYIYDRMLAHKIF